MALKPRRGTWAYGADAHTRGCGPRPGLEGPDGTTRPVVVTADPATLPERPPNNWSPTCRGLAVLGSRSDFLTRYPTGSRSALAVVCQVGMLRHST